MSNPEFVSDDDIRRTLSIVRELSLGKVLTLPSGHMIGMGDDMSIGGILVRQDGSRGVAGLSTMDLKDLNALLTKNNIGFVIPSGRKEGY